MRFSTRSKVGGLLSLLAIVTIITAFMLGGLLFRGTATHASNAQYSATQGTLTPAGTVNPTNVPPNLSLPAAAPIQPVPRPIYLRTRSRLLSIHTNPPSLHPF